VQAEKTSASQEISFWGCPGMNFRASLPFHAMREAFAAFSKRSQRPPFFNIGDFQSAKVIIFFSFARYPTSRIYRDDGKWGFPAFYEFTILVNAQKGYSHNRRLHSRKHVQRADPEYRIEFPGGSLIGALSFQESGPAAVVF